MLLSYKVQYIHPQLTPDSLNLQGKPEKVQVSRSLSYG